MTLTDSQPDPAAAPAADPAPAPSPAPAPEAAKPWYDGIADEKQVEFVKRYPTRDEFVKGAYEGRGKITTLEQKLAQAVVPLTDKSTPEEREDFYRKLGKPEKSEDYGIAFPDGVQATEDDKAALGGWSTVFHGANLNKEQAKAVTDFYFKQVAEAKAVEAEQFKAAEDSLRADPEWTGARYEERMAQSGAALAKYFGSEVENLTLANGMKLGNHPGMAKGLYEIAKLMGESKGPIGLAPDVKQTLEDRRQELMDRSDRWTNKAVHREIDEIARQLWPDRRTA